MHQIINDLHFGVQIPMIARILYPNRVTDERYKMDSFVY